ncbi:hypothetical protein C8R47DRAFT_1227279 [Mycena vitilis]|nr:hypothetical protein C8R47DRAFT_1227279 [Mycena vitilis]
MSRPGPLDLVRYRNLLPQKISTPISAVSQYHGDLQVGERYKNMDYSFCRACVNSAIAYDALIIYDYSCPLAVDANFRMKSCEAQSQPKVYPSEFYDDLPALVEDDSDNDDEAPLPFRRLRAKL